LTVGGNLCLFDCTGITSLPEGLTVQGDLGLRHCTGITSLPERLSVGGSLNFSYCTGLTSLPEGLTVGGNLILDGCTGITSLPNWITTLGLHAHGFMRQIHLPGAVLPKALLNSRRKTPPRAIQSHFPTTAAVPPQTSPI